MNFKLQNCYQDGGWENLDGEEFDDFNDARKRAKKLRKDAMCYGMVRVIDSEGSVIEYPAGSGKPTWIRNKSSPIFELYSECLKESKGKANKSLEENGIRFLSLAGFRDKIIAALKERLKEEKRYPDSKDITCEEWREYDFDGRVYRIDDPIKLYVGKTTHRVVDAQGIAHCIPAPGFNGCVLRWKSVDPNKPVAF